MKVGVPKESMAGERRAALVPESVQQLENAGLEVIVQAGAGESAGYGDDAYRAVGAEIMHSARLALGEAAVILKVQRPLATSDDGRGAHEAELIPPGAAVFSFFQPALDPDLVQRYLDRNITSFSMELVPRITRAQRMDALSSQATVAGYRAALVGAAAAGKFFPMLMTAAGTIPPARVLVLGAGVAGLQAIATSRRLGAVVQGFDIRPEAKEQVESLGAKYVGLALEEAKAAGGYAQEVSADVHRREQELLARLASEADVVITTALIPGKRAPVLISEEMVRAMKAGAVIVDLAAEAGGNCALTQPGREVEVNGVRIIGLTNAASAQPLPASQMYSRNVSALLVHHVRDGRLAVDLEDEITKACCVTHEGRALK